MFKIRDSNKEIEHDTVFWLEEVDGTILIRAGLEDGPLEENSTLLEIHSEGVSRPRYVSGRLGLPLTIGARVLMDVAAD